MRQAAMVLLALAAIAGAFFLGRWSREPPEEPAMSTPEAGKNAAAARSVAYSAAAPVAADARPLTNRPAATADRRAPLPHVPVSARASGPQPLRPEDEPRLAKAERLMEADGGTTSDLLDLSREEEQDERARQLEALIVQSIMRNGGHYTGLRLSPPHCTRSVCIIRGIGAGHTQDPRSDWQRLSLMVMNEPWFREAFDDMRSMVTGDGPDTMYITLYIRCAPGTCLHGSR